MSLQQLHPQGFMNLAAALPPYNVTRADDRGPRGRSGEVAGLSLAPLGTPPLGPTFGVESPEAGLDPVVDELHHLGDGMVARLVGDEAVHSLTDPAVSRVALGGGSELEHVHRLASIHVHRVADAKG